MRRHLSLLHNGHIFGDYCIWANVNMWKSYQSLLIPQVPCRLAPGLSGNVRSYTISINKETVEQEYICTTDSNQCSYTWSVASHEIANFTVSVAANNVIGQSDAVYCTTTSIGEHEYRPFQVTFFYTNHCSATFPYSAHVT